MKAKIVYISDDGKEFDKAEDCIKHENRSFPNGFCFFTESWEKLEDSRSGYEQAKFIVIEDWVKAKEYFETMNLPWRFDDEDNKCYYRYHK